jgi:hypothetical protein
MPSRSEVQYQWSPEEILVRLVEGAEALGGAATRGPEAGVYAPSFNLWDGAPVLDLLFKAIDAPKQKGRPAPMLVLNLLLPKADSSQRPL